MQFRIIAIIFSIFLLTGCSGTDSDARLMHVAAIVSDEPEKAMALLDSIGQDGLSEADRHFYDLLSVKARDKAYVRHTSDSLILDVIGYYSSHRSDVYPEALYYGGRVYSDLGDLPSALRYFQDALSELSCDTDNHLRGNVLSQTGRLLDKLRLYEEAIPYLEQVISIDSAGNDTFNLAYDHELIGNVYLHAKQPDKAAQHFKSAKDLASTLSSEDRAHMTMYLAACALAAHHTDSALSLIRGIPDSVAPMFRNISLAYASDIYLKAGIPDTAYIYAHKLVSSKVPDNRKSGYSCLLSPELVTRTNPDSLVRYILDYKDILEEYYDRHESQQTIMQNTLYNYQVHEKERHKAEESRKEMIIWFCISLLFILLLIIGFLIYHVRSKQAIIRLNEKLAHIEAVRQAIVESSQTIATIPSISSDVDSLRAQLREKISQIATDTRKESVPSWIVDSDSYRILLEYVNEKKMIVDSNPLWKNLHDMILQGSPDFDDKLRKLMGRPIKQHELQTVILIKCGITPVQMTFLLGKTKGSISSRRESLCISILGEKVNQKAIDTIINLL